jgi:hypothetical protein
VGDGSTFRKAFDGAYNGCVEDEQGKRPNEALSVIQRECGKRVSNAFKYTKVEFDRKGDGCQATWRKKGDPDKNVLVFVGLQQGQD